MPDAIVVVDLGTTGVRSMVLREDGAVAGAHYVESPPEVPAPGLVEHDPQRLLVDAEAAVAGALAASGTKPGGVGAVGITVQRATTVVWDARTSEPVGPAIGWQDLRTLGECLGIAAQGFLMPPNASGTKAQHLVRAARAAAIPDATLRFGTLDTWLAWNWSGGELHVTDPTNAGVTAMADDAVEGWRSDVLSVLDVPDTAMPQIVPTSGVCGTVAVAGVTAPLACLVGDQQSSLVGQGGIRPGIVKATFGSACMVDANSGRERPPLDVRSTYPVVVARTAAWTAYGREATVISAGDAVRGLVQLGLASDPAHVSALAADCPDSGGVVYVPALLGLGTPHWDYGARGTVVGLTLGTDRRHIARAVLEGIANRATECVLQLGTDSGLRVSALHVDGGAAASEVLCQAQADRLGIPVLRSAEREATAFGCGLLAGLGTGVFSEPDVAALPRVDRTFEPSWDDARRDEERAGWAKAISASRCWLEGLSAISF